MKLAWRLLPILAFLPVFFFVVYGDWEDGSASAAHYGHRINNVYVQEFTEDIPGSPSISIPVYECSSNLTPHASAIKTAVKDWSDTNLVRFNYVAEGTTCIQSGPFEGMPEDYGRIAVYHNPTPTLQPDTANYSANVNNDSFRDNDIGTEGDVGMFPFTRGRIHLSDAWNDAGVIRHELGHAAGLADLYNDDTELLCDDTAHGDDPNVTLMDCSFYLLPTQASHDLDNLTSLYQKQPTQVDDFTAFQVTVVGSQATVWFGWTDKSFNEEDQEIWMLDSGTPIGTPLISPRDWEVAVWPDLTPDTDYCFYIKPVNAYGISATPSAPECITTTETKPDDGILTGTYDFLVESAGAPILQCISLFDHGQALNDIRTSSVCYTEQAGTGDPADLLEGVYVPGEGPDGTPGPPPPPPYNIAAPSKGYGTYYPSNPPPECGVASSCFITESCISRTGAGSMGPNLGIRMVGPDPDQAGTFTGTAELYPGLSNDDCDSLNLQAGASPLTLSAWGGSGSPWRSSSASDWDDDGCMDRYELTKPGRRLMGCGDDPWNPLDSNQTDYSGSYEILIEVTRADLYAGGSYFSCLADLQQTGNGKTDGDLTARTFCYLDGSSPVNLLGYPDPDGVGPLVAVSGDGFPGGGPPWGTIPVCVGTGNPPPGNCKANPTLAQLVGEGETDCSRFAAADEDLDGVVNDGCPGEGFGDTDSKQTELKGYIDNNDNTIKLRGCFEDEDDSEVLKNVYVEITVNKNTGIGTVDIWPLQNHADCTGSHAWGAYSGIGGPLLPDFDGADVSIVRQPGGQDRDTDQDGASNAEELRDDGADCGLRDPFNPYDWYDVNQDGVIDQANDILGVIQHYSPAGAPPYEIAYDRGKPITGGAGNWSREAPDGAIDLSNDILGVIQQYHPGAC